MRLNKKAFVLLETIVVITVLSVTLIVLYASYSKIISDSRKKMFYDNTEYIYKTSVIRKYLEPKINIATSLGDSAYHVYCSNTLDSYKNCNATNVEGHDLFKYLSVNAIYFTDWNTKEAKGEYIDLEATTQIYLNSIDVPSEDSIYRITVMFEEENNVTFDEEGILEPSYQYASLRIGSRK